jgi:DNA-binding GntR family transcriptional regulator
MTRLSTTARRERGAENVYGHLRDAITTGRTSSGEHLRETQIAASFGVGRNTVREALARLEHEGLVERHRHRGARVRGFGPTELLLATDVVGRLEGLAAARAAERCNTKAVQSLRKLHEQMKQSVRNTGFIEFFRVDAEFHDAIVALADAPLLERMLHQTRPIRYHHRHRVMFVPGRLNAALLEHGAIIDAIGSGDSLRAEQAVAIHYRESRRAFEILLATDATADSQEGTEA